MKKTMVSCLIIILFFTVGTVFAGKKAPQKVVDLANSSLTKFGENPVIISAVKTENAKGKTLAQIKKRDKQWVSTPGVSDNMKALIGSACGMYLQKVQDSAPYFAEIFIMDNQGANVAMTDKTSDYWQGDEPKFTKAYNNGSGTIYISDVNFDDSTQTYLVHVSVPVMDGEKTIGVITLGVDVNKIE